MKPEKKMTAKHLQSIILCFLLFLSIAILAGWARWGGDPVKNPWPDINQYLVAYKNVTSAVPPYRYRPWTPLLARMVPAPPERWLDPGIPVERQQIFFRFLIVNVLGLAIAATALRSLASHLTRRELGGWLAALLFIFSFYPLMAGTLPMVEAWSYAWLTLGLLALLKRQHVALAIAISLGLLCKETTLLLLPAALLLPSNRKQRFEQALTLLLPTAGYLLFRRFGFPPSAPLYSVASTGSWLRQLFVTGEILPNHLKQMLAVFHLLWIPALGALWQRRHDKSDLLVRWSLLIPIILAVPILFALVLGRVWFFAFPFLLPLAAVGILDRLKPTNA
jgi:hypothetical protein